MGAPKGKNNFASHQKDVIEGHAKVIEAELKDIRRRTGVSFKDLDSLIRYLTKVTGLHRTTLKRNTTYRRLMREFLARQQGSTSFVKIDDAPPDLLRSIVEDRDLTISNLNAQLRILKTRLDMVETSTQGLAAPATEPQHTTKPTAVSGIAEAAFQDTAIALLHLIQHINKTTGVETLVVDEENGLILDAAIPNPRKRREMAIGPERSKAFIAWYKANKHRF